MLKKVIYSFVWLFLLIWITIKFGYTHIYFIGYSVAAMLITLLLFLFVEFILFLYRKFEKNKLGKAIVTILLILLGVFIMNGGAINKFKPGFYFEKYKTIEEVKKELLKLYPIGSDVEDLVKTLELSGAEQYQPYITEKYRSNPNLKYMFWYKYKYYNLNSMFSKSWTISIKKDKDSKLEVISVGFYEGE
jgi:hypothetical protein